VAPSNIHVSLKAPLPLLPPKSTALPALDEAHVPFTHRWPAAHALSAQHGWPLPPHVPHVVPHCVPGAHALHGTPPRPHAALSSPTWHAEPLQQPLHEVGSHPHTPATHRWPLSQVP
jgi:hypothetical protein